MGGFTYACNFSHCTFREYDAAGLALVGFSSVDGNLLVWRRSETCTDVFPSCRCESCTKRLAEIDGLVDIDGENVVPATFCEVCGARVRCARRPACDACFPRWSADLQARAMARAEGRARAEAQIKAAEEQRAAFLAEKERRWQERRQKSPFWRFLRWVGVAK